jgi:hypothetical protein
MTKFIDIVDVRITHFKNTFIPYQKKILGRYFVVWRKYYVHILKERIINGGVMVSMFVFSLSVVDRGFMPQWSQTKDYKIGILLLR